MAHCQKMTKNDDNFSDNFLPSNLAELSFYLHFSSFKSNEKEDICQTIASCKAVSIYYYNIFIMKLLILLYRNAL